MTIRPRPEAPPCPCGGLNCSGERVTKHGHVRNCSCRSCIGRRNRVRGQRGQRNAHRALGGTGFTPSNEESARTYVLQVQVETKAGAQIPRNFVTFTSSDWLRRALRQAEMAIPIGTDAKAAVAMLPEGGGKWLVVKLG